MLLTMEQAKYLVSDLGEEGFIFKDYGKATLKEKQDLIDLDDDFYEIYGKHIIQNIEELIKQKVT